MVLQKIVKKQLFKKHFAIRFVCVSFCFRLASYIGYAILFTWYYNKLLKNNFLKYILQYALYVFLAVSIGSIALNFQHFFDGTFKLIRIGNMSIIMLSAVFYLYELL